MPASAAETILYNCKMVMYSILVGWHPVALLSFPRRKGKAESAAVLGSKSRRPCILRGRCVTRLPPCPQMKALWP